MKIKSKSFFLVFFLILNSCVGSSVTSIFGNAIITEGGIKNFVEDSYIYTKINAELLEIDFESFKNTSVNVFEGRVLLTGSIENEIKRLKLIRKIWKIDGVKAIYNEIEINENYTLKEKTRDILLETEINTLLLLNSDINSNNYSIEVFKMVVYVLGVSTEIEESLTLENLINKTKDVKRIVTFIRYIKEKNSI